METINRRAMMRGSLCIAAAAGAGVALSSSSGEAMSIDTRIANAPDGLIEEAQWGPPPRHWHHGPRQPLGLLVASRSPGLRLALDMI